MREAGRPGEAEGLLRRVLKIEDAKLGPDDVQVAWMLGEMARYVQEAGRPGEAEALYKRALEMKEAKMEADHVEVAWTLGEMGQCVREAGRPGEAESFGAGEGRTLSQRRRTDRVCVNRATAVPYIHT